MRLSIEQANAEIAQQKYFVDGGQDTAVEQVDVVVNAPAQEATMYLQAS